MGKNIVKEKSFLLAIRIVRLFKYLKEEKKEYVMSKQLLRSGTSVGANIRESEHAQSKPDFISKLSIAQKEMNETLYWLELLNATEYLSKDDFRSIHTDSEEVMRLLASIIKSTKANL